MNSRIKTRKSRTPSVDRVQAGFTLAEVLAAMVFIAIVIPVALEGLSIAARAGDVAQRKVLATRVAERLLNEAIVTRQATMAVRTGTSQEGPINFRWTVRNELWREDLMRQLSAEVMFTAQNHDYSVLLTTLILQQ